MPRSHLICLATVLALLPFVSMAPQAAPILRLGRPTHSPDTEFSAVTWVVELRPGLLLVGDARNHQLASLDLATGVSRPVARPGAGPREYRTVGEQPLARPEGGVYVVDPAQRRLLPVSQHGVPFDVIAYSTRWMPQATDRRGRIYGEMMHLDTSRRLSDSVSVVRIEPTTEAVDTLLTFDAGRSAMLSRNGQMRVWTPTAAWAALQDGRITVITSMPYQLRLWSDGRWSPPIPLPGPSRQPTAAEKASKALELASQPVRGMGKGAAAPPPLPELLFPARLPAFESFANAIQVSRDGALWIRRLDPSAATARYDVVDAKGFRGAVALPASGAVVGFGEGAIYVSETDRDDIARIRRYTVPRLP